MRIHFIGKGVKEQYCTGFGKKRQRFDSLFYNNGGLGFFLGRKPRHRIFDLLTQKFFSVILYLFFRGLWESLVGIQDIECFQESFVFLEEYRVESVISYDISGDVAFDIVGE